MSAHLREGAYYSVGAHSRKYGIWRKDSMLLFVEECRLLNTFNKSLCLYVIRKEKNLRRMNTAVKLNQLVKDRSKGTQLLVINLPGPPSDENDWQHCILFNPLVVTVSETS